MSNNLLFDFLDSINQNKKDIMDDFNEKEYVPYVINHFLSGTVDSVLYAQEMNQRYLLDKRLQYDFLRLALRPKKRYSKWLKPEKLEDVNNLMIYYGVNRQRATEVLDLHTDEQLKYIKKKVRIGGPKNK